MGREITGDRQENDDDTPLPAHRLANVKDDDAISCSSLYAGQLPE